jgi:butyryl-CoA dehydrogenase
MDFEPTPDERVLELIARTIAAELLPALPADPIGFARVGHAELGKRGLYDARTMVGAVLAVSELSRTSASLGAVLAAGWLFADAIARDGGPAHAALATAARRGSKMGCLVLQDPRRWSDPPEVSIDTDADGTLLVTGKTRPVVCAPVAEHAIVVAPATGGGSGGEGGQAGATVAYVDLTAGGVRRGHLTAPLGLERAPYSSLDFSGARLATRGVLSGGHDGLAAARALVDASRIFTAAIAVGVARRATARVVAHLRALGHRPAQSTEFVLSDLLTFTDAASLATIQAAWLRDAGRPHTIESAGAKLLATRLATRVAHGALGVCGEGGHTHVLRRSYLDARFLEMQDGAEAAPIDAMASEMLGE